MNNKYRGELDSKHEIKEIEQENIFLDDHAKHLDHKIFNLEKSETNLKEKLENISHQYKNEKQEKIFLENEAKYLDKQVSELETSEQILKNKIQEEHGQRIELEQERLAFDGIMKSEEIKAISVNKKYYLSLAMAGIIITGIFVPYSMNLSSFMGHDYKMDPNAPLNTGYEIQNLKGDTINTWLSWRLVSGSVLHVGIVNAEKYPDKVSLIKEIVLSNETIQVDDSLLQKGPKGTSSTYYTGWEGALNSASKESSEFYIPTHLEVAESAKGEGEITIVLSDQQSGDGYSGYTRNIADESQNQILKSSITIYGVDKLSDTQFKTVLRHELGHAFGLAHTTATEDLMHPTIETNYPYISECDVAAIKSLYDGGKKSEVTCEK